MPEKDGIGYGPHTPQKVHDLGVILRQHIAITFATRDRYPFWQGVPYHYIDATAGAGECPELKLKGSPLVFLDAIADRPFRADLIERVDVNLQALAQRVPDRYGQQVRFHGGNYEAIIPQILEIRPPLPLGLLFVDPTGEKPDLPTLQLVARARRYMELLMYVPATIIKRCRHLRGHEVRLEDYTAGIAKKYWLVREPSGKEQWTFLLGTNTANFKDYRAIGFYRLDSEQGQAIFFRLNYTVKEIESWQQPSLPLI
jgi:three-Cys-motif partner protein